VGGDFLTSAKALLSSGAFAFSVGMDCVVHRLCGGNGRVGRVLLLVQAELLLGCECRDPFDSTNPFASEWVGSAQDDKWFRMTGSSG
jgi:hypothetical protein